MLGLPVRIVVSDADETVEEGTLPADMVEQLALRKALAVAGRPEAGEGDVPGIVVGADTIVVESGTIFGKPENEEDAFRMLKRLQNNTHRVYTGIACIDMRTGRRIVRHAATEVTMKPLSDEQIRSYIATGEPSDKAGAYAVQGIGATIVTGLAGDYFNVVGLSLSLLSDMLGELDSPVL